MNNSLTGGLRSLTSKFSAWCGYVGYRMRRPGTPSGQKDDGALRQQINSLPAGWPSNHTYRAEKGRLRTNFQLFERCRAVSRWYRPGMTSLLDIGCCRGYYVLDAAGRPGCSRAVGVDVSESFIDTADVARRYLRFTDDHVQFHVAGFAETVRQAKEYGAPFDTIVFLGTYHYVFWGTPEEANGMLSHDAILGALAGMCSGHVLLSGRLDISHLPSDLRRRAEQSDVKDQYTLAGVQEAASRYFNVRTVGSLGRYTLMDLSKRQDAPRGPAQT